MEGGVFGVLDVAVPMGFAFQGVALKLCFRGSVLRMDRNPSKCVTRCK